VAVLLNAGSGTGTADAAKTRIAELFGEAGITVEITLAADADEFQRALTNAIESKVDAIVAGGSDGTISTVADALADHAIPLGVLPLGTLNHFARDLGIPAELDDAVRVVLAGRTTRVDVGEVNGRIFLNNSSLGLYPKIVRLREQYAARGLRKWIVAAWATAVELGRFRRLEVQVDVKGERTLHRTPLLMIGNNRDKLAGVEAGARDSLQDGLLAVYIVKARSRWQLFGLVWKIFRGTAQEADELDLLELERATINARGRRHHVALDGEVTVMEAPLKYRVRPTALTVFIPAAETVEALSPKEA
jgi:YegS/Rv2252/BmrU family lipid kinase